MIFLGGDSLHQFVESSPGNCAWLADVVAKVLFRVWALVPHIGVVLYG